MSVILEVSLAIFLMYVLPVLICHMFAFLWNKFDIEKPFLSTPEVLFVVSFIPFVNWCITIIEFVGSVWLLLSMLYNRCNFTTHIKIAKLFGRYANFIVGDK